MADMTSMTQEMFEEYQRQLEEYRLQYEQVLRNLQQAKAEGDVSDNAGHDLAMRDQEQLSGKIQDLLEIITSASIIQGPLDTSRCSLFTYVTLEDTKTGKHMVAQLVESNQGRPPMDGNIARISCDSQVGQQVFGKAAGTVVEFLDGNLQKKILKVLDISAQRPNVVVEPA